MSTSQASPNTGGTVQLHHVFSSTPEKIWRAFTQPDAFARWLPPNGMTARVYEMNATVGGIYRMSFTNFTTQGEVFLAGNTWNWLRMKASPTPQVLKTRVCPVR